MTAIPILKKALLMGGLFALALAVGSGIVGMLVAGTTGLVSGLLGAIIAGVFLGITALSIVLASRYDVLAFFGIVMGAWLLKFILFIVLAVTLREQPWIDATVLFITLVIGVIGTLVIDLVVVAKSRMSYVSDISLSNKRQTPPDAR